MRNRTPQGRCHFGIARGDITPPVGIYHRMWGAAAHDRAEGVHRPLLATAMVIDPWNASDDENSRQVVVALDHCLLHPPQVADITQAICRKTGIAEESVLLVFSHTHAAGLLGNDRRDMPGGDLIPEYLESLNQAAAELVAEALAKQGPATLTCAETHCSLAGHRDLYDPEEDAYVCGWNPDGTADQTVSVVRVTRPDGTLQAVLVHYACHPTTLAWDNRLISPDYPGALRELVERSVAAPAPCVFLQGASGDLGPREGFVGDPEVADRNGRQLGYAALSALESMPPPLTEFQYSGAVVSGATIGTWRHVPLDQDAATRVDLWQVHRWDITLAYRDGLPTADEVEAERQRCQAEEQKARDSGDEARAADCRALAERQTRMAARIAALPAGTFPYRVVLMRTGDIVWIALPGEPYQVVQQQLRQRFPQLALMVCTLAGGWGPSYLPPADSYGKGIYQETVAVLKEGCLEQVIQEVGDQLARMIDEGVG